MAPPFRRTKSRNFSSPPTYRVVRVRSSVSHVKQKKGCSTRPARPSRWGTPFSPSLKAKTHPHKSAFSLHLERPHRLLGVGRRPQLRPLRQNLGKTSQRPPIHTGRPAAAAAAAPTSAASTVPPAPTLGADRRGGGALLLLLLLPCGARRGRREKEAGCVVRDGQEDAKHQDGAGLLVRVQRAGFGGLLCICSTSDTDRSDRVHQQSGPCMRFTLPRLAPL